jgi:hypothetical protein
MLFVAGAVLTVISYVNNDLRASFMYMVYGFYTLMELLQAVQYAFVNDCSSKWNVLLTEVAYVFIIVQPLIWNAVFYMKTRDDPEDRNVFKLAMVLSLVWIAANVYSRISYDDDDASMNACGFFNHSQTCTYRDTDKSHLYWRWKTRHLSDMTANYFMYLCLWIVPAIFVESTRSSGIIIFLGMLIGIALTKFFGANSLEFPTIWCAISIPILIIGYAYAFMTR